MLKITIDSDKNNVCNLNGQVNGIGIGPKNTNPPHIYKLDDAIEAAKIGKSQYILTFLTGLCIMGSGIENTNISYILPFAKCDLKLTSQQQGFLSAISYLGIVFSSHLWGFFADVWGRKKVLRVAAMGGFIFSFASAFAINTITLIILRFFAGAFVAGATSAGYSYISEFHTSKTAARAAAFVTIALMCVWIFMSPLAMAIIPMDWSLNLNFVEYKPWRFFLTCTSLMNLWNAFAFSFLPESPKFLLAMNRKAEALQVLSRIYALNTGQPEEKYPVKDIETVTLGNDLSNVKGIYSFLELIWTQTKPVFQQPLFTNTWKLCYIIFVIFSIGHGLFVWFPDLLIRLIKYNGLPKTLCEVVQPSSVTNETTHICDIDNKNLTPFLILLAIGICFFVFAASSSFCMKKIEPKKLVAGWLVVSVVTCVLLNFLTNIYSIVVSFVIFLSCNVCANIVMAVAVNLYPTNYRAMATALIMVCGRIGSVSGSSLVGVMLSYNCSLIFYLFGGMLITCALVFMTIKTRP